MKYIIARTPTELESILIEKFKDFNSILSKIIRREYKEEELKELLMLNLNELKK